MFSFMLARINENHTFCSWVVNRMALQFKERVIRPVGEYSDVVCTKFIYHEQKYLHQPIVWKQKIPRSLRWMKFQLWFNTLRRKLIFLLHGFIIYLTSGFFYCLTFHVSWVQTIETLSNMWKPEIHLWWYMLPWFHL